MLLSLSTRILAKALGEVKKKLLKKPATGG